MGYIYLASPYSSPDPKVRTQRFLAAERLVADHLRQGVTLYSPIVYCHEIACRYHLPFDVSFWWTHNENMLKSATELWVYDLPGWEDSKGVARETAFALRRMIPIAHVHPEPGVDL